MCGRYYIEVESDLVEIRKILTDLNERFADRPALARLKSGEIFPTDIVPVIRPWATPEGIKLLPDLMQWGFAEPYPLINARAETADSKPTFRNSFQEHRVLVPATAFFEWQQPAQAGQKKTKLKLSRPQETVFYMAGLYRPLAPENNPLQLTGQFVILTSAANESIRPIHDRMPLIVPRTLLRSYLQDINQARDLLHAAVLQPFLAEIAN
ncbi:MAG: SOS response-associated peptidase [Clostridia bacterium]|nr:SOS response-associated peptidase [Clostridia bacterium]